MLGWLGDVGVVGGRMSRERDEEVHGTGHRAREHRLGKRGLTVKYPFSGMLLNDWFVVWSQKAAIAARNAATSFCNRHPGRRFAVRQREDGEWICRRMS